MHNQNENELPWIARMKGKGVWKGVLGLSFLKKINLLNRCSSRSKKAHDLTLSSE